jgi:SAM-dependent methyltransferase
VKGLALTAPAPEQGRRPADYYPTPEWCVEAVLPLLLRRCPPSPGGGYVLEPGCGHGAIALPLARAGYHVRGVDIRPECAVPDAPVNTARPGSYGAKAPVDYLEEDAIEQLGWARPMAIVGNPPYSHSADFIKVSLDLLSFHRGLLCFLLPLDYLGTQGRAAFWREHPADVMVLDRRPSFTGGGTASTNYGWFMWPPENRWRGQVFRVGEAT